MGGGIGILPPVTFQNKMSTKLPFSIRLDNPPVKKKKTKEKPDYDLYVRRVSKILNIELAKEHKFHATRQWRFDFALPCCKLVIEVEGGGFIGGRHTRGAGFAKDMEKYNTAAIDGWRILRFIPSQLTSKQSEYFLTILREYLTINTCPHKEYNRAKSLLLESSKLF